MVCIYKTRVYQSSYIANLLPFDIGLMTMEIPHVVVFRFSTKYVLFDSVVQKDCYLKDELLDKMQSAHSGSRTKWAIMIFTGITWTKVNLR